MASYSWEGKQKDEDVEATEEQRAELIKAYEWAKAQFEKRLNTYLKKYGTSKMRCGTYWRDR